MQNTEMKRVISSCIFIQNNRKSLIAAIFETIFCFVLFKHKTPQSIAMATNNYIPITHASKSFYLKYPDGNKHIYQYVRAISLYF